jgi:predicted dehydrogenase
LRFIYLMGIIINKARIILVGCGPHAKRVYLPALRRIQDIELSLVIDLESQAASVRQALTENPETELLLIKPFSESLPADLAFRLSTFVLDREITGVIIATEPLVHRAYAEWALQNGLSILMDKPITARAGATSKMSSAEGILEDYLELLESYRKLQFEKETIFMINSHRRFHRGFQFVKNKIQEIGKMTNCPVTFIQAYHCDGQWRLPSEIVTQEYHPYRFGYGKASHSGYHIFDTIYQFYKAAELQDKFADTMEIVSSFIQPNGFFTQFKEEDYQAIFGEQYNLVNQWTDDQLKQICTDYGEIDLSSIITLKKNEEAIANFTVNLIHNGFAGRTWIRPGEDLYKGNGRIKHESYHIQQGPFQSIQIHAYQANDKHDEDEGQEDFLGGKNHFEIYVFRNPLVAGTLAQPQVYKLSDIIDNKELESESVLTMEWVKFKVVEEFADYLTGKKNKELISSQIEDHLVPVQIMSGIYCSNILRKSNSANIIKTPFGLIENYS